MSDKQNKKATGVVPPPPPVEKPKTAAKKKAAPKKSRPKKPKTIDKGYTTYTPIPPQSLYNKEYCQQLIKHREKGFSYESFAAEIDVCRRTLYAWEKVFPEWAEAKEKAYEKGLLALEKMALMGINGKTKNFNSTGLIFYASNRFRKDFQRNPEALPPPKDTDPRTIGEKTKDPIAASKLYEELVKGK